MSTRILNRVWEESEQRGANLFLLIAMADNADHRAICYPGIEHLAWKCRISPRQVTRILGQLVSSGEIEILKGSKGRGSKTVYKILTGLPTTEKEDILSSFSDQKGDISGTERVTSEARTIIKEPIREPSSSHTKMISLWMESYSQHFGCAYAFQDGKDAKAVKSLLASTKLEPEQLIAIAKSAWANGSAFYCKSAASITGFNSRFNEIRQELKNGTGKKSTSGISRNTNTANEGKSKQYAGVGRVQ